MVCGDTAQGDKKQIDFSTAVEMKSAGQICVFSAFVANKFPEQLIN